MRIRGVRGVTRSINGPLEFESYRALCDCAGAVELFEARRAEYDSTGCKRWSREKYGDPGWRNGGSMSSRNCAAVALKLCW